MEQRFVKILLGVALVAIWGLFGYRVYQKMKPSNDFLLSPTPRAIPVSTSGPDTFQLSLNYEDPFFGRSGSNRIGGKHLSARDESGTKTGNAKLKGNRSIVSEKSRLQKQDKVQVIVWPFIAYKGSLKLRNGREAALLSINGKTMNLGLGENYEGVMLSKIEQDSIQLRFKEELKLFGKIGLVPANKKTARKATRN